MNTLLIAAALLIVSACTSAKIIPSPPIEPPRGATLAQIETAIRDGVARSNRGAAGGWIVEGSQPSSIVAGLRVKSHYLQVTIDYSETRVISRITGSHNLDQDVDSIHRRALAWQRQLDGYIFQELSKLRRTS